MGCTTILVGKDASYDGSTIIARNEDSPNGQYAPKKTVVVLPEDQPRKYTSVLSRVEVDLPDNPLRYTAVPNALDHEGLWASAGVNAANVAMSATETLTSNERVLGADPLVVATDEQPGGLGEEDLLTVVLPYVRSAREGVLRLGALLEKYGTYEMNGIAFSDEDEIWWMETIGGHHWIAKRVPDNAYVAVANQFSIDDFDIQDALEHGRDHLASADLADFIADNHLDLTLDGSFNARDAFGSHSDADHVYNTPRVWDMQRFLNPETVQDPTFGPLSDTLEWSLIPPRKVTIEDVKYALSRHFQGTPYDPYGAGGEDQRGIFRPIGINRHSQLAILQIRPYKPKDWQSIQWMAYAANPFNTLVPLYTNVEKTPEYLASTTERVTSENFYWASRIIAALADAHYFDALPEIERYQEKTLSLGHANIRRTDQAAGDLQESGEGGPESAREQTKRLLEESNESHAAAVKAATDELLSSILFTASNGMRNGFHRSDN